MPMAYVVHILAGSLGLVAGYVALSAAKGATLHRKSGMAFVGHVLLAVARLGDTVPAGHRCRQRP